MHALVKSTAGFLLLALAATALALAESTESSSRAETIERGAGLAGTLNAIPGEVRRGGRIGAAVRNTGELLPSREDTWWTVDGQTDTAALSKELLRLLDSKAIAWLESRATIDDLVSSLRRDPKGISSYELAHMQKALLNAGEFAAADLVREEQRRRHPGRTD